jgi:hypothetical protein
MQEDSSAREAKNVERDRDLRARAMRDEQFRQSLLRDPKGTLERELGAKIPAGVSIQVHEETENTVHVVVPGRGAAMGGGPDKGVDDTAGQMRLNVKSDCCTCGSSSHQTFKIP